MKNSVRVVVLTLVALGAVWGWAAAAAPATFSGSIGDAMCGMKHTMGGTDKECTLACIKEGSSYVLVDSAHNKVYKLSDQTQAAKYPGEKVSVTGTLSGETIQVSAIKPAK